MSSNEDSDKNVAYYSACVQSWFATRMELDKSLLTLSGGGIGILVTLLADTGLHSIDSIILYILSLCSFITCVFAVLYVLKANSGYLEQINQARGENKPISDSKLLSALDILAIVSFGLGVLLTSVIGTGIAFRSFQKSESAMSEDKIKLQTAYGIQEQSPRLVNNSYNKAEAMKPRPAAHNPSPASDNMQSIEPTSQKPK